ncbi:MAG: tRNA (guanosine(46)-N7)-methyltransferase TrmB, partial [Spirochaetota bacterium]|nr:tRNA (guanosine(46)-N7)-methyltransferase TrmB [Spirochaetota bacterium]
MDLKKRTIRSYVLRSGRLSSTAARALQDYSDLYALRFSSQPLDLEGIFPVSRPVIVEIGFGMGHVTVELARTYPEYNYLGIEVYPPGVGRVLNAIHTMNLENLRVIQADAAQVLESMIPAESIHGFHIFFPDPWPKKKHHKRRLLQAGFLHTIAGRLQPGGYFYAVTDWEDYAEKILEAVAGEELLVNPYNAYAPPRQWRPKTSFQ